MQTNAATIKLIQCDENGDRAARISCHQSLIPTPGRYTLATHPGQPETVLGRPLFPVGIQGPLDDPDTPNLGPVPDSWKPGDEVHLRRPAGRGFQIPTPIRRLALASFGETPARLLPLVLPAIQTGADIALFTPAPERASSLPPDVEIQPVSALGEALSWASFLAIDIPLADLAELRAVLGLRSEYSLPCPAQALVWAPMPCGALADCGACAVPTRKGSYKLACKDGPVFDLNHLAW